MLPASFGRTQTPPWGMTGGGAGSNNCILRSRPDASSQTYGRISDLIRTKGDTVSLITGGGGGWGDPALRSAEDIARDMRDGLLTEQQASAYPQYRGVR